MNWETVPAEPSVGLPCELFGGFGWYFEALKVNPENADDISLLGVDMYQNTRRWTSWFPSSPIWWTYEVDADKHDLVYAAGSCIQDRRWSLCSCIDQSLPWRDIENISSTKFYRTVFNPLQPEQYFGEPGQWNFKW